MNYNYIVVEGNIGAGKTTLAKKLAESFGSKLILEEFEENAFLPAFYNDPEKYSFQLELSFLAERYQQVQKELINRDMFHDSLISDYLFQKCVIFAKNNLEEATFQLYQKLFGIINASLPQPDIIIYLHQSIDQLLSNIQKRGRDYEKNISAEYLEKIQNGYLNYLKHYTKCPVLIIDTQNVDFVENKGDYDQIMDLFLRSHNPGFKILEKLS